MPSVNKQLLLAKSHLDNANPQQAQQVTAPLILQHPTNYHAHVLHGAAFAALSQPHSAKQSYQTALALRPNLPLAHRAIIDLLSDSCQPSDSLLLARAYANIAQTKQDPAQILPLLQKAAHAFRNAPQSPDSTPDQLQVLNKLSDLTQSSTQRIPVITRIADLLVRDASPHHFHDPPIATALDDYANIIADISIPLDSPALHALITRTQSRYPHHPSHSLKLLQSLHAHEAILRLAEHHTLPYQLLLRSATRAIHHSPTLHPEKRSHYHLAAALHTTQPQAVHSLPSLSQPVATSTAALVQSIAHLSNRSYKQALKTAEQGLDFQDRHQPALRLIAAAAHQALRAFKPAHQQIALVVTYAQQHDVPWLLFAAHVAAIDLAVRAHGRASRNAALAMEDAASAPHGLYAILESVWSDALAGDVDIIHMQSLVDTALVQVQQTQSHDAYSWEFHLLRKHFLPSNALVAATACMRLAQMMLCNADQVQVLENAQKKQMHAASLCKDLPGPFAHLGWIFECLARRKEHQKMIGRAVRCYEKAVALDAAHPLASRRLATLLVARGALEQAARVADAAANKNPKARWAHNVIGWIRLRQQRFAEASVSFRNALRGNPRFSSRDEELLFGTGVATSETDNALVVDVDSWRGLSASYREQSQVGPALSCIDDALNLIDAPPKVYTVSAHVNLSQLQGDLRLLLLSEKAVLLQMQKNANAAVRSMESLVTDSRAPTNLKTYLSDAYVFLAAEEWLAGCYHRATLLRQKAATCLDTARIEQTEKYPFLNPSSTFKRLGDSWMEVASTHPKDLARLVPIAILEQSINNAIVAYTKAMHFTPWTTKARGQDLGSALLQNAMLKENQELAQQALSILLRCDASPTILAIGLIVNASLSPSAALCAKANRLALQVSKSLRARKESIELNASLAIHAAASQSIGYGAEAAVAAIRQDPTDWRGWFAVAAIRECDARDHGWVEHLTRSCEHAYREADRLGGGPPAAGGRARCLQHLLESASATNESSLLTDASFCSSTAARAGNVQPSICGDIMAQSAAVIEKDAKHEVVQLQSLRNAVDIYRHIHMFPFIPEVRSLSLDGLAV